MVYSHKTLTRIICISFFILTTGLKLNAQVLNIDYYGVMSHSPNINMLKMAQDMFYTQLKSIDAVQVDDKRTDNTKILDDVPDTAQLQDSHLAFYTEIKEYKEVDTDAIQWQCILHASSKNDGNTWTHTDTYESYYKILVNTKNSLEDFIREIKGSSSQSAISAETPSADSQRVSSVNIENLAGTWEGEPFADKIIILRGGRGFIVYKNGATMNIRLNASTTDSGTQEISIKQTGAANASFFPELSREQALSWAGKAEPIEWIFHMKKDGTLEGKKRTLIQNNSEPVSVTEGYIETVWNKK